MLRYLSPYPRAFLAYFGMAFFAMMSCAHADGIPQAWGMGLQESGSFLQDYIHRFHNILLVVIVAISVFVLALMIYVMVRYNVWTNKTVSTTTHNVKLEIIWTLVPCLILLGIAFISFPLLYYGDRLPAKADVTMKVTGHQWYWSYEYPDLKVSFDSRSIWDTPATTDDMAHKLIAEVKPSWLIQSEPLRMLEVDNRVVLPVGKVVRVQIAGADVEHSWFVPSLGVNRMTVPGNLTELWINIKKPGIYYGQCSMICGAGHAYMPIVIEGVTPDQFNAWVESKVKKVEAKEIEAPKKTAPKTAPAKKAS